MRFSIFQESRIGKRKINQDRMGYAYTRDVLMMVVADGMGGHPHGEVAAQIAVDVMTESFQSTARTILVDPFQFLSRTLNLAHRTINETALKRGLPEAPRTTCIACVVQNNVAYWAHVGDSRLYAIRGGRVLAQTRDHSQVQLMIEQGLIDADEASTHPARNRVYSCLGGEQPPEIEFSRKTPVYAGDLIVLCSDGAWAPLREGMLVNLLSGISPIRAVPNLLDQAEALSGRHCDNLTMLAMQWDCGDVEQVTTDASCTVQSPSGQLATTLVDSDNVNPSSVVYSASQKNG